MTIFQKITGTSYIPDCKDPWICCLLNSCYPCSSCNVVDLAIRSEPPQGQWPLLLLGSLVHPDGPEPGLEPLGREISRRPSSCWDHDRISCKGLASYIDCMLEISRITRSSRAEKVVVRRILIISWERVALKLSPRSLIMIYGWLMGFLAMNEDGKFK